MAGHSKWANIKHKKERADQKKGKVFSRLAKEIISAVKQGGVDPKANTKLRLAIQKAKASNLPNEIIERNIKKASSKDQANYFEITYELYGKAGVGIIVEIMTDNKNRIASEIRLAINKCGGSIAQIGSVSFNFDRLGIIQVEKKLIEEDALFTIATENGAKDFDSLDEVYLITTDSEDLYRVKEAIESKNVVCKEASIEMVPKTLIECTQEDIEANTKLIEWLENIDDVDSVYHNMQLSV